MSVFTPQSDIAEWHLTYRCNLACTNCNRLCFLPPTTDDMTTADAELFVRQCRELNWSPAIIIIGGEPTLNRDFFAIIEIAASLSPGRVSVWSNGFGDVAAEKLARVEREGKAAVCHGTIKPNGGVVHLENDYFLAPVDYGETERDPCDFHACGCRCGISVDHEGYTICPCGGAFDGALGLGVRTTQLAQLFDGEFAARQTTILCRHCGHGRGIDSYRVRTAEIIRGAIMSPTWAAAIANFHEI